MMIARESLNLKQFISFDFIIMLIVNDIDVLYSYIFIVYYCVCVCMYIIIIIQETDKMKKIYIITIINKTRNKLHYYFMIEDEGFILFVMVK